MSDSKSQVLCKYYMSGACRFGRECAFSHDLTDLPNQVCKYYLAGCCAYGDRCRYDHKRPEWWKAAKAAAAAAAACGNQQQQQQRNPQHQQQPQQQQQQLQQQQQQQQRQTAAAAAAQHGTPGSGSGSGGGGGSGSGAAASTPTRGKGEAHLYTSAWGGPVSQAEMALRLPRSLSDDSAADAAGGGGGAAAAAAAAVCGARGAVAAASGRRGDGDVVAESWKDAAAAAAAGGPSYTTTADAAAQGDEQAGEYDEYGDGMYGDEGFYYSGYDQQDGYYYYGDQGGDEGGNGADDGGGEEYDNDGGDDGGGGGGGGGGEGLVMVDDDVGLEQERAAAARAAARGGGRWPVTGPLGGGDGGGGGGGAAGERAPPPSRWAAAQHPWEAEAGGTADGTADPVDPAEVELCPGFALHGRCAEGEECPLIHGMECEICHKFRIHPYNADAADEHRATCRLRHERLEARLRSAGVECGICLEPVMDKPSVTERRFGLLSGCDHAFCLACIRSWRGRNGDVSLAVDTAVRACPLCRAPCTFVTPSLVWPASGGEKAAIVAAYRQRLATIDCKHFDFGEGSCPFSSSCFYRHMYRDGRMEEPVLRRVGDADGDVRVVAPVRLSAFFDTPRAQQLLGRRR